MAEPECRYYRLEGVNYRIRGTELSLERLSADGSWRPDDKTDAWDVTTNGRPLTDGEVALQEADIKRGPYGYCERGKRYPVWCDANGDYYYIDENGQKVPVWRNAGDGKYCPDEDGIRMEALGRALDRLRKSPLEKQTPQPEPKPQPKTKAD